MNTGRRRLLGQGLSALGVAMAPNLGLLRAETADQQLGPPAGASWPPMKGEVIESSDGAPIFFRHGGEGSSTVLFIHGWSCSHRFFGPQFAAVGESHRIVALDLAGHGQSGSRTDHTVGAFADDVLAVAARFPGPLLLVVHSAGGRIACEAAPKLGERLLGIVGIDSFQNLGYPAPSEERVNAALDALRKDFSGRVEQSLTFLLPAGTDPALRDWILAQMASTDPDQAIATNAAFARADAAAAIAGFDRPIVALNSDGVPTNVDEIRKIVPGFSAEILKGQGHFPHLTDPESFNRLLLKTLQQFSFESTEGQVAAP